MEIVMQTSITILIFNKQCMMQLLNVTDIDWEENLRPVAVPTSTL